MSRGEALASLALALSSGWALLECSDLKFAKAGFCLYLVDGVLGVVEYLMPSSNRFYAQVQRIHETTKRRAHQLYLPLIAAEAIIFRDDQQEKCISDQLITYLCLIEPLLTENLSMDMLDLYNIPYIISLGFSYSEKDTDIYGGVCALVNCFAFLYAKEDSMEFLLLVGAANLVAAQFFKGCFI